MANLMLDGGQRNGVISLTRGSLPVTFLDSMSPAMSMFPLGSASPGTSTYAGTAPNELVLNTYSGTQNDRSFGTIQFNHDMEIPAGGTVTFSPHIHWTCSSNPTTNTFVEWRMCYSGAAPGLTFAEAGTFSSTVLTSTGRTTVPTSTGAFAYRHLLTDLQDFTVASSLVGASYILAMSVQVSSVSTLDVAPMLLSVDVHYRVRGGGTVGEYV